MKKILPFALLVLIAGGIKAQDSDAMKKHYLKMYNNSLAYNDLNGAIYALYGYLATDNSLLYKDTLSMLYFTTKNYYSALLAGEEVYKAQPSNTDAMARTAECYDELGDPKTAVSLYEQVCPKTKNPYHIYKMAVGQYQLKRTAESELSARVVIADTSSKRIGVNFTTVDGQSQAVPVNAAAANLMGVLKMDAKNYTGARADFQQALAFFPNFVGAKQNLETCEKNIKGGTKPPATKPKGK